MVRDALYTLRSTADSELSCLLRRSAVKPVDDTTSDNCYLKSARGRRTADCRDKQLSAPSATS